MFPYCLPWELAALKITEAPYFCHLCFYDKCNSFLKKKKVLKDQWLTGVGVWNEQKGTQRIFREVWYYRVDICHYNLSKPITYTTWRVNCNVNSGLWVIMMCQCRLISCNRSATLVEDVDGEGCAYVGAEDIWEVSLTFLSILLWT